MENRKQKIAATIITSLIMVVCVMPMAGLSKQAGPNRAEYKNGIEYDQNNGPVVMTYPAVLYEAFFVEVDEDKDLDLGAEFYGDTLEEDKVSFRAAFSTSVADPMPPEIREDYTASLSEHDAVKAGIYPGQSSDQKSDETTNQSGDYDVTHVEVLRSPHSNAINDDAPEEGNPQSIISGYGPSSYSSPDPSIDFSSWSPVDLLGYFRDNIIIDEMSFPDMETALETLEYRTALTRNILIPSYKMATIKIPASVDEREHVLGIKAQITEDDLVNQNVDLTIYKSYDWPVTSFVFRTNGLEIKDGSTLALSCPVFKNTQTEGGPESRTKLYIFLTSRVFKTAEDAQDYIQMNNKELSTDVFYTDPPSDDYGTLVPDPPEWIFGVMYDDAERMEYKKDVGMVKSNNF